jgi:hypothetical protein
VLTGVCNYRTDHGLKKRSRACSIRTAPYRIRTSSSHSPSGCLERLTDIWQSSKPMIVLLAGLPTVFVDLWCRSAPLVSADIRRSFYHRSHVRVWAYLSLSHYPNICTILLRFVSWCALERNIGPRETNEPDKLQFI